MSSRQFLIKRVFDVILASILLIVLSPAMLITGILIGIKLGKPVIFSQERPGYKGTVFTMYKFRSMRNAVDDQGKPLPDDQRMTGFGRLLRKLSIDELPELINILRGEMSFVGPRPLLVEYLDVYTDDELRRHDVLPGLTGWAQVNGRNAISWKKKFELDLYYVDHYSIWLDIRILVVTFLKVIKRADVNQEGHVTIEKYNGMN